MTRLHVKPEAASVSMRMFVAINGWTWRTRPDIDDAEATVLAVAAADIYEAAVAEWLRQLLVAPFDT
jgi:hypothetical protein